MNMTSIKRLLLATDFSEWARGAEVYACALAASWRAQLTVMTVVEFPPGHGPGEFSPSTVCGGSDARCLRPALRVREGHPDARDCEHYTNLDWGCQR